MARTIEELLKIIGSANPIKDILGLTNWSGSPRIEDCPHYNTHMLPAKEALNQAAKDYMGAQQKFIEQNPQFENVYSAEFMTAFNKEYPELQQKFRAANTHLLQTRKKMEAALELLEHHPEKALELSSKIPSLPLSDSGIVLSSSSHEINIPSNSSIRIPSNSDSGILLKPEGSSNLNTANFESDSGIILSDWSDSSVQIDTLGRAGEKSAASAIPSSHHFQKGLDIIGRKTSPFEVLGITPEEIKQHQHSPEYWRNLEHCPRHLELEKLNEEYTAARRLTEETARKHAVERFGENHNYRQLVSAEIKLRTLRPELIEREARALREWNKLDHEISTALNLVRNHLPESVAHHNILAQAISTATKEKTLFEWVGGFFSRKQKPAASTAGEILPIPAPASKELAGAASSAEHSISSTSLPSTEASHFEPDSSSSISESGSHIPLEIENPGASSAAGATVKEAGALAETAAKTTSAASISPTYRTPKKKFGVRDKSSSKVSDDERFFDEFETAAKESFEKEAGALAETSTAASIARKSGAPGKKFSLRNRPSHEIVTGEIPQNALDIIFEKEVVVPHTPTSRYSGSYSSSYSHTAETVEKNAAHGGKLAIIGGIVGLGALALWNAKRQKITPKAKPAYLDDPNILKPEDLVQGYWSQRVGADSEPKRYL